MVNILKLQTFCFPWELEQTMIFNAADHPHRRCNPLTGDWVLVSSRRTDRPWQGQVEKPSPESLPAYHPDYYLCPGNERAGSARNPQYEAIFVFTNDFAALLRSATVRKFMVGYEMLSEPQHDLTAEAAAARLRALPKYHFSEYAAERS